MNSKIQNYIKKREVCFFGEVEHVVPILEKFINIIPIKKLITVYKDEVKLQSLQKYGIESVLFNVNQMADNLFYIICSKDNEFSTIEKLLLYSNCNAYEDYISSRLLDSLIENKKVIVCMGTQMLEQVSVLLNHCPQVNKEYSIIYYPEREFWQGINAEYIHISQCADISIQSACNGVNFQKKKLSGNAFSEKCKLITIADYGFWGYYPQIFRDAETLNPNLMRVHERVDVDYETLVCARIDMEIQKKCEKVKFLNESEIESITKELLREDYYDADEIRNLYDEEIARWHNLEENDDIKLSAFLEQNKGNAFICKNLHVWGEPVITYIANQIINMLKLQPMALSAKEVEKILTEVEGSELPIYPSVQYAFGMQSQLKNKKYEVVTYNSRKYMSLEEYIRYMVKYTIRVIDLNRFTGWDKKIVLDLQDKNNGLARYINAKIREFE